MSLKPWREIARPHKDVLEGSFKQSEFAADISQVSGGSAPDEYQNAEKFFSRTYITEGMRLLLISVAQRLAGHGGDPVVQLQTAFGGGKTHTMLAVYHLASREVSTDKLMGIPPVLDEAGISELPRARMAVIDGIRLSPSQARTYGSTTVNTLWGELAWQLLGEEGFALVANSDTDGTSPGKEVLKELLNRAAPCVILIDELVAFTRQLELGKQYIAGTFDSNISFIQALTEALKAVPNAILLASLPESELEVGGTMGQRALESLETYFARVESVWKPVGSREAFEIVRRRLFESSGERAEVEGISRQFSDFYRQHADKFPVETQSNEYFERLCSSYPIHPEVFDRLYEDWSTLDKFQRTRGVLQYMAIVIHRLWNSDNRDALIMPGSLPLEDTNVRNKSIHYLPQGWEPVIEKEVDGQRSIPADIDGHQTLFGGVQAARRTARCIFLGSAPSSQEQMIRGIQAERVLLGTVQPGQTIGVFEDVLKRLRDRLHYLYAEQDRYWLDTKPNLRREMESRKQNISERDDLIPMLKERVSRSFGKSHHFGGIHVFTPSVDVPDDYGTGPRLVILPTQAGYSRTETNQAIGEAEMILRNRGEQPRQKQNRLIFLAPDFDVVSRLKEQGRIFLAWRSIVVDIESGALNQDLSHLNQAKRSRDVAEQSLTQLIRETWKWLLAPVEDFVKNRPLLKWEVVSVSPTSPNLIQNIEEKLKEEEWMVYEWSPIHLRKILADWYLKNSTTEVSALKVWQDTCHYLYLPRLINDEVFRNAIRQGVETEDFFGFASGKEDGRYLGFSFGKSSIAPLDESSILIEREAAAKYAQKLRESDQPASQPGGIEPNLPGTSITAYPDSYSADSNELTKTIGAVPASSSGSPKTHFYGTISLDAVKGKMDFATIMDEVVQQFTAQLGVDVTISVEIEARKEDGFDESLQRTVKENCNVLKFSSSEFDE
ncbi:ATP-binding protein [Saccharospirillum alexandrii]|uniref:ATP-binding protein n=1 Tax=Saccharospirillum alexandrii TaxID=2448477 RepID=UPI00373513A9